MSRAFQWLERHPEVGEREGPEQTCLSLAWSAKV